ncbi:hypothetical protein EYF80_045371 [Liparis tanakae]|uniref:Uncharacterized protein n=1 Tax=Liparis tanakae TaxID=230148 RepID=A0A4Z2FT41_9TELE|nr:hypothetical protein EYF80_045371 [Liparis tanakae]
MIFSLLGETSQFKGPSDIVLVQTCLIRSVPSSLVVSRLLALHPLTVSDGSVYAAFTLLVWEHTEDTDSVKWSLSACLDYQEQIRGGERESIEKERKEGRNECNSHSSRDSNRIVRHL